MHLIFFSQGKIEAQGTPSDLSRSGLDFAEFIGNNESHENDEKLERQLSRRISTETVHEEELIDEVTEGIGMEESSKGKVKGSLAMKYYRAGGNWFCVLLVLFSFALAQLLASLADYWVSVW